MIEYEVDWYCDCYLPFLQREIYSQRCAPFVYLHQVWTVTVRPYFFYDWRCLIYLRPYLPYHGCKANLLKRRIRIFIKAKKRLLILYISFINLILPSLFESLLLNLTLILFFLYQSYLYTHIYVERDILTCVPDLRYESPKWKLKY